MSPCTVAGIKPNTNNSVCINSIVSNFPLALWLANYKDEMQSNNTHRSATVLLTMAAFFRCGVHGLEIQL